jgi:hypothetical protein
MVELPQIVGVAGAEPVPRSRQNAVYYPRTISKNGEDFGGIHVDGGSDWKLSGGSGL